MSAVGQHFAIVALGSNVGDSQKNIRQAIEHLRALADETFVQSSLWDTTPVDCPLGSPRFVNAVVAFKPRPRETPETLLEQLQTIEREFGRPPKKILNEPRSLDLDIIAFAREHCEKPMLTLPHPRAHQRKFVLVPLCEIAPDFVFPGSRSTAAELLAVLNNDEQVERL